MTAAASAAAAGVPATRRLVVTRPVDQAEAWVEGLRQRGVAACALPLIGIADAEDRGAVEAAWAGLDQQHLLVFVSPNAAVRFFALRPPGRAWPAALRAAAPGPGTSEVLRGCGIPPGQVIEPAADAAQFDSEALWAVLGRIDWRGARALIVRGEGGRGWLADQLLAAGAQVDFLSVYRRGPASLTADDCAGLHEALATPGAHLWLFSSSEAVDHLLAAGLLGPSAMNEALARATAIATHPRIADRARAAGFGTVCDCRPEMAAVVACIQSFGPPPLCGAPPPAP